MPLKPSRRNFLQSTATATVGAGLGALSGSRSLADQAVKPEKSPNEQVVFGYIGAGIRFHSIVPNATNFGPAAALADVDDVQRGRGLQTIHEAHYKRDFPVDMLSCRDYRRILDRNDIDAVVIATPDHWHTKMAIEAMQAGKDVYCEKPLTLTIREGQQIREALAKYPQVMQVGTQQRTEHSGLFVDAATIVRDNRVGKMRRVTCAIGNPLDCSAIPLADVPRHLDWDAWLGQAPMVDYRETSDIAKAIGYGAGHPYSRTHNYFRWWYEYSGGKLTDWGAHHVDIAMWAMEKSHADVGPIKIDPIEVYHPVPLDANGMPTLNDRFNVATQFKVRVTFDDGVEMDVYNKADHLGFDNGIMFQGEEGRFFVNRGKLTGKPVEDLKDRPLPSDALEQLYGRKVTPNHMADFVECMKTRNTPVSDAESHHRNLSVCHAINIAMRLGRSLTFDPATETFQDDPQANGFLEREQRKGYEIVV